MKRQILITTLFSFVIGIGNVISQGGVTFEVNYTSDYSPRSYASKDIREFHAFQRDVTKFTKAVNQNKSRKARRIKRGILRSMRNEIQDTEQKIRFVNRRLENSFDSGLQQKRVRTNNYSIRSGNINSLVVRNLNHLEKQLRAQKRIYLKLENMYLDDGRSFFRQGREYEILLNDFEVLLKSDINISFKDYRNRNRMN